MSQNIRVKKYFTNNKTYLQYTGINPTNYLYKSTGNLPVRTAHFDPAAATWVTLWWRGMFLGTDTWVSSVIMESCPYSEFPQPNRSPRSDTASTQSPLLEICTILSPSMSPLTKDGRHSLW